VTMVVTMMMGGVGDGSGGGIGEWGRDEKKRLDHLKQDQEMLVIKIFSKRKKVFRERKKCEKIRAKRGTSLRYGTGKKKVNEVDFISQGVELVSRKLATMTNSEEVRMVVEQDIDAKEEEDERRGQRITEKRQTQNFRSLSGCPIIPPGSPNIYGGRRGYFRAVVDNLITYFRNVDAHQIRFGGNDESKRCRSTSGAVLKDSLYPTQTGIQKAMRDSKSLSQYRDSWRRGMDSLSFDDLYNNLRVFENDVKGSTASSSNLQNVAFVSEKPTKIMLSENQANIHAGQQESNQNTGTKDKIDAGDSEKEDESAQDCFELPIWHSYSSTNTSASKSDNKRGGPREEEQVFLDDLARLQRQEKGS
ncbi:hypothetical protein Tco_1351163, partial [Tanacetum coccineum]